GNRVIWETVTNHGTHGGVRVSGDGSSLGAFEVEIGRLQPSDGVHGTQVTIGEVHETASELLNESVFHRLCGVFGPYLRQYPSVKVSLDGRVLDPGDLIINSFSTRLKTIRLA